MTTVAFDITHVNDRRRTGIGRVVEENLRSLAWLLEGSRWEFAPPALLSAWPLRLDKSLAEALRRQGARFLHLPGPSMYIWRATRLSWWVARHRPGLLFIPEPIHPGWLGTTRLAVMHYDLITRHHPATASRHIRLLYRHLLLPTLRRAARVGVDSEHVRAETTALYTGLAGKSEVLPIFVHDPASRPARAPDGLDAAAPFALFVGNLMPHKNVRRLLDAFEQWHQAAPPGGALPLVIAGRLRPEVDDLAPRLGELARRGIVRHLGYTGDDHLEWLYRNARFLAFPSRIEGLGLPVLEAMSRGCPVLTSRGVATEEAAGGAALLVDPESTADILRGLREIAPADVRGELARRGLAHARTFTRERHALALHDFLRKAARP